MQKLQRKDLYKLSIVIPTFNSASYIVTTLNAIHNVVRDTIGNVQFVVVNDGNFQDVTAEVLKFKEIYSDTILVNLQKVYGQQIATNVGLSFADGEFILIKDDDLQFAPADIIRLFKAIEAETNVLMYNGYSKSKSRSWKYEFGAGIVLFFINYVFFPKYRKTNYYTSFKIFRRDLFFENGIWLGKNIFFFWDFETQNIRSLAVKKQQRISGKSRYTIFMYIRFFRQIILKMFQKIFILLFAIWLMSGWFFASFPLYFIILIFAAVNVSATEIFLRKVKNFTFKVESVVR